MKIDYVKTSKFLEPCIKEIKSNSQRLEEGDPIEVIFIKGGYNGEIVVNIDDNKNTFDTSWKSSDPTRFPARIKAATTALKQSGCFGAYKITHYNGVLTIKRVV